ncbi:MAG: XdhC/CoxI family protein [Candidatus Binatia bacterium]
MRDILDKIDEWLARGEQVALATLVGVRGSAPRRPGASMAVTAAGAMAGSVSGGCVETAVIESARTVLATGAPALESYGLADEQELDVGLPCGSVDILVERLPEDEAWREVVAAVRAHASTATAVALEPAAMRGRRLVLAGALSEAGARVIGSIDPALDASVVAAARALVGRDATRVLQLDANSDTGPVSVFVQGFARPDPLIVIGATEIAVHLARLAAAAGFRVTVIDPRSAFADPDRFDVDVTLLREWPDAVLTDERMLHDAYLVALSHDTKFDVPALERGLRAGAFYVGALGSARTHERRCELLRSGGVSEEDIRRIHSPVGLDIGAQGPYQIAVAVLAELIAARNHCEGGERVGRRAANGSANG